MRLRTCKRNGRETSPTATSGSLIILSMEPLGFSITLFRKCLWFFHCVEWLPYWMILIDFLYSAHLCNTRKELGHKIHIYWIYLDFPVHLSVHIHIIVQLVQFVEDILVKFSIFTYFGSRGYVAENQLNCAVIVYKMPSNSISTSQINVENLNEID